jgi:hypothetical protein
VGLKFHEFVHLELPRNIVREAGFVVHLQICLQGTTGRISMRKTLIAAALMTAFTSASASAMPLSVLANLNAPTFTAVASMMMTLKKDVAVAIQPDSNAKIVGQLKSGTQVTVVDKNGQWTHIQVNGMDGYVPTGSLK